MTFSMENYCKTCTQVRWQVNGKHDDHPYLRLHFYHLSQLSSMQEEGLIFQDNTETCKKKTFPKPSGMPLENPLADLLVAQHTLR